MKVVTLFLDIRFSGLVSKVFPPDQLVDEAVKAAEKIAKNSKLIVMMAKEAVSKCKCIYKLILQIKTFKTLL